MIILMLLFKFHRVPTKKLNIIKKVNLLKLTRKKEKIGLLNFCPTLGIMVLFLQRIQTLKKEVIAMFWSNNYRTLSNIAVADNVKIITNLEKK